MAKNKEQEILEKEKFDSSLSDDQLLIQIKKWEEDSQDFYEFLKDVAERNLAYYRGEQTNVSQIHGRQSKTVENRIWMGVETAVPIVTSRLPEIVVRSEDEDERSQLDSVDLQAILNYKLEEIGIQEKAERFTRDMLVKRMGVFKAVWRQDLDDFDFEVRDPRKIRIPKYGTSVDELKYIIEYLEMSYEAISDYFGKELADKILGKKSTEDESKKVRKNNYIIKEIWTNDFVVYSVDGQVLKKEDNPYYNFDNKKKNYFLKPRKPYIIKSLFETEESLIGETDYIQQLIPIQDNINNRKRQIENIAAKVANPILLIDSQVMSEERAENITNEEGLILYGKDAAKGDKVRFESPGNLPNYLFTDLELSRKEFDNIWGLHSTTRGEREGRETATGRQILREADLGRIDLIGRQVERALGELAEWGAQMIKLFYDNQRSFAVLGSSGLRFIKGFTGDKINNVRLMIKPGSTLPKDEVSIRDNALALWQYKAIGVKTLYKMMKLPNIDDAMEDYIQTQSGAILQGQGVQPTNIQETPPPTEVI